MTRAKPHRCAYCGSSCYGRTCTIHKDLPKLDPLAEVVKR